MILLSSAVALAADCEGRGRVADLDRSVGRAEIALQSLDPAALAAATADAERDFACLYEPLGTHHIARWFRAAGIHALVTGDAATGRDLLMAARALEPEFRLDPDLGAPIQEVYARAAPTASEPIRLAPPSEGWVVVDGRPTDLAPADRTCVIQWFGDDGAVRMTALLHPGAAPPYPFAAPKPAPAPAPVVEAALPAPLPPEPVRRAHPSRALALGGVGSGLLAGAGIAWASSLKHDILVDGTPSQPLVNTNRAVGYTAGGLGLAALGLGVGAVAVGEW